MATPSAGRAVQILGKIRDPCIEARKILCGGFLRPDHSSPEYELRGTWNTIQIRTGITRASSPRRIHDGLSVSMYRCRSQVRNSCPGSRHLLARHTWSANATVCRKEAADAGLQRQRSAAVPCRRNVREVQVVKSHIGPRSCGVRENSTRRSAAPGPRHPLVGLLTRRLCLSAEAAVLS